MKEKLMKDEVALYVGFAALVFVVALFSYAAATGQLTHHLPPEPRYSGILMDSQCNVIGQQSYLVVNETGHEIVGSVLYSECILVRSHAGQVISYEKSDNPLGLELDNVRVGP